MLLLATRLYADNKASLQLHSSESYPKPHNKMEKYEAFQTINYRHMYLPFKIT